MEGYCVRVCASAEEDYVRQSMAGLKRDSEYRQADGIVVCRSASDAITVLEAVGDWDTPIGRTDVPDPDGGSVIMGWNEPGFLEKLASTPWLTVEEAAEAGQCSVETILLNVEHSSHFRVGEFGSGALVQDCTRFSAKRSLRFSHKLFLPGAPPITRPTIRLASSTEPDSNRNRTLTEIMRERNGEQQAPGAIQKQGRKRKRSR